MKLKGDIYINLGGHRVRAAVTEIEFVGTRVDENGTPEAVSFGEEQDFDTYAGALLVEDKLNVRLFDQLAHDYTNEYSEESFTVTYDPLNAARIAAPVEAKKAKK